MKSINERLSMKAKAEYEEWRDLHEKELHSYPAAEDIVYMYPTLYKELKKYTQRATEDVIYPKD